jgi:hypothetical protein
MVRAQQPLEFGLELTSAMVPAIGDQPECGARSGDVDTGRHSKKSSQIADILWTSDIVSGKDLQGNQMCRRCDANTELWQQLDFVGFRHNLRLNSGRREEQVDDGTGGFWGSPEPRCREASHRLLLNDCFDLVAGTTKGSNESFRFSVAGYGNGNISIAGESRFGACGNCQPTDQREEVASRGNINADLT